MAYTPTVWVNDETAADEDNMNHIEQGIKNNDDKLQGLTSMGSIVVDSIRSKNMFDKNVLQQGSLNSTTGVENNVNYIVRTNYIWLKAGTYTIKMNNPSNFYLHTTCTYDTSKTYISTLWVETTYTQTTITLNSDCYIRFSFRNTSYSIITPSEVADTNIQLEKGETATPYSPYQNLSGEEVYSTSEIKIGTWIDGKPLYRRVIVGTSINVDNAQTTLITIPNISECFIENASVINTSTGYTIAMLGYNPDNTTQGYRVWVDANSGYVKYQIKNAASGVDKIRIILCYTKTTD